MLQPPNHFEPDFAISMAIAGIDAFDPETRAYLTCSRGRSRYAPKWFLFFADYQRDGEYLPYKEWRTIFRAWTFAEALQIANRKLEKLIKRGKVNVTGILTVRGARGE